MLRFGLLLGKARATRCESLHMRDGVGVERTEKRACFMKVVATTSSNEVARNMLDRNFFPRVKKERC